MIGIISEIKAIISEVDTKSQTAVIFQNKFTIINRILQDIDFQEISQYQQQCQSFKQNLTELLQIIDNIQDEQQLFHLLVHQSMQQFVYKINHIIEKINSLMNEMGIDESFKMPVSDIFNDLTNIDDILVKTIIQFQKRRNEISELMKQTTASVYNNSDEDNINELNKYPQYKLKKSDFQYEKKPFESNRAFDYYNGTMNDKKVTVMKLKINSLFKRLLTVFITIDHPYIEKFLGAYIEKNKFFIVTDRNGYNLTTVLDNQNDDEIISLQPGERTILAFKIAQAMSYLHSKSVMHRNLTTDNIIINRKLNARGELEIEPKIVGFKNSRLIPNENTLGISSLNISTKRPVSYFRAPELDDGKYDEKVDVFAFSGILYQILTGHKPFEKESNSKVVKLLYNNERPPLNIEDSNIVDLINGCWDKKPNDRFSFDQILFKMVEDKIVFPTDESEREQILKFYIKNAIKNNKTRDCLKAFDSIQNYIGNTFQFRFEFERARSLLSSYKFQLTDSEYLSKEELTKEEADNINELYSNLLKFQTIANENSEDQWESNIELYKNDKTENQIKTVEVMENITKTLKDIYQSMHKLGFDNIEKYKENAYDLLFDINELINFLPDDAYVDNHERITQFMEDKKLEENNNSQASIQRRLKDLFSRFKHFELDPKELEKVDDSEILGGYGATSSVYKKKYKGQIVAVKEFKNYIVNGEHSLGQLRREIGYLTKLRHPNIVEFIGYVLFPENKIWIVSKFIKDGSLEKLIENKKLSGNDKTKIAFKVALAMEYIHSNNVIHLDLKPANILVDGDDPKITDFGLSAPSNVAFNEKYSVGTYRYMAPEIFKLDKKEKSSYAAPADVFSYALILWNLYSGKIPFDDLNDGLDAAQCYYDNKRCSFDTDISNSLKDLIIQAWDEDPNKRPTFEEIVDRMKNNYIMFPDADKKEMEAFYNDESAKRSLLKIHFK